MSQALPVIEINGVPWFIDLRLGERRRCDLPFVAEPESRALLEYWIDNHITKLDLENDD